MQATGVPAWPWPAAGTIYSTICGSRARVHNPGQILQGSICMSALALARLLWPPSSIPMPMRLHYVGFVNIKPKPTFKMKTSISFISVLVGLCLTGVQADLPYNMPEWRRDASPPFVPPPGHPHLPFTDKHHHRPTGTEHHHHHTATGTGHHHPTGVPSHHHKPAREFPTTFETVTGTGHATGTGGYHPHPTGGPWHPPKLQCKEHTDCKMVCPTAVKEPQCIQGHKEK
ncbi:hypothetical protein GGR53DRAFT_424777 [Hypoxylon sp. FL1150]|nr:hypothetical protein GGR53DRAFT_424777 [Hypoxylon sp. FL1150]